MTYYFYEKKITIMENRLEEGSFLIINRKMLHRNIFSLAWPSVTEYLLYTITMMVDMIMVSRLGTDAIAAVGLSNIIAFTFISMFGFPLRISSQALTARFSGAHLPLRIKDAGGNSLMIAIIVGLTISILGILGSGWLLKIMGASESVHLIGVGYLRWVLGIAIFRIVFFVCSGILRGMGDARTPMFILLVSNIINIIFNYFLIFGIGMFPRLNVLGAGIATGGAYIIAGISLFVITIYFRKGVPLNLIDIKRFNRNMVKNIWRIALPASIETVVRRIGLLIFIRMVAALGTVALAAHQLAIRIEAFSFMIGVGFGVVSATLVGQSLGAKKIKLAEESIKKTSYYSIGLMSLLGFVFVLFPGFILQIFKPEMDVKTLSTIALIICAFEQIPLGLFMVITGGLKGAGDTKTPMIISVVGSLLIRVPLTYILAFKLNLGFVGIWLGALSDWWVKAILGVIAFYRSSWKELEFK